MSNREAIKSMKFMQVLILFLLLLLGPSFGAKASYAAGEPIVLSKEMLAANYTESLDQIVDSKSELRFEELLSKEYSKQFERIIGKSVRLHKGARWFQMILENPTREDIQVYLQFDIVSHVALRAVS